MSKKILILSPINQYGGVNMDVAFLSKILGDKNNVKVISLANYFEDSSVYYFDENLNYNSLNRIIYDSDYTVRYLTKLVSLIKPLTIPNHFRIHNFLTKLKQIQLEQTKIKYLSLEIEKADIILVCSQLTAEYNSHIINLAFEKNKIILLKVTGQINNSKIDNVVRDWIKKVDLFIFHSYANYKNIESLLDRNKVEIIDQHSYLENQLLNISIKKNKMINFFTLSRFHSIKQIHKVIDAFNSINNSNLILNIYGDGDGEDHLKKRAKNKNIKFHGKVDYKLIPNIFKENDCLIIASKIEAGPYTGIESMASGTPIISTIVGAMEERLGKEYPFFYDGTEKDLIEKISVISSLNEKNIMNLSQSLRNSYLKNYSKEIIENKNITTLNKFI